MCRHMHYDKNPNRVHSASCCTYCVTDTGLKNRAAIHHLITTVPDRSREGQPKHIAMKRNSFIAAFVNNAAAAIITNPDIIPDLVFALAEHYADIAEERGYIEHMQTPDGYKKIEEQHNEALELLRTTVAEKQPITRVMLRTIIMDRLHVSRGFADEVINKAYLGNIICKQNPENSFSPIILSDEQSS